MMVANYTITFCNGEKFVGTETAPTNFRDLTPAQNDLLAELNTLPN
jgi:hypothetical protein